MASSREWDGSSSDYLTVTDDAAIQDIYSSGGTAMVWAYVDGQGENNRGHIYAKTSGASANNTTGGGFQVRLNTTVRLGFYGRWSSALGVWETTQTVSTGQWINLAVTMDTSSSSNDPTFYFDTVAQTTSEVLTPSGTFVSDVGDDLYIGNTLNDDRCFDGKLCCLQLWTRVLSVAEMKEAMFKPGTVRSGLAAFWPILGADSPERDLSGNGNTGAVTGTSAVFDGPPITKFR